MPALRAILLTLAVALVVAAPSGADPASAPAPAAVASQAPQNGVTAPRSVRIGTLRNRGLRSTYRCATSCRVTGRLTLAGRTARRYGLTKGSSPVTIGRATARRSGKGSSRLTVRLTAKARRATRRMRSGSVVLITRVRTGSSRVTQEFTVRIKR